MRFFFYPYFLTIFWHSKGAHVMTQDLKQGGLLSSKRFRSERNKVEALESFHLLKEGKKIGKVLDWSRTGLGFESETDFQIGTELENVDFIFSDFQVFCGALKITRKIGSVYGATILNDVFHLECVDSIRRVMELREQSKTVVDTHSSLDPKVCHIIIRMKAFLETLKESCSEVERSWQNFSLDKKIHAETVFAINASKFINQTLLEFNNEIDKTVDVSKYPENSIYHKVFEREITPYFMTSGIGWRAYVKPRKYAGDYEMMNQIYRDGFEGSDLLGKLLHNWIVNEASSQTVKFRRDLFAQEFELLKEKNNHKKIMKVASIACGPAMEVQDVIKKWSNTELETFNFNLIDLDREALEHAEAAIRKLRYDLNKDIQVNFINENVREIIKGRFVLQDQNLVYSAGLFDYLDNVISKILVERLYNFLAPGGKLIIGNYTYKNPTKPLCHFMTNWHLIHKSEEEMGEWVSDLHGAEVSIKLDPTEINAFLVVEKPLDK
jgi:extracellular factor (EF) 3-hydroxypalmitic acid methyl ester biosynthesis protein